MIAHFAPPLATRLSINTEATYSWEFEAEYTYSVRDDTASKDIPSRNQIDSDIYTNIYQTNSSISGTYTFQIIY